MPDEIVHAAPPAAFPARLLRRRLCGGLLLLPVVGGARRRRLRRLRGDRRRVRSRRAKRLREYIYAAGGPRDPAEAYMAFRGRLPTVDALLKKRGLVGRGAHEPPHRRTSPRRRRGAASCGRRGRPAVLAEGGNAIEAMVAMAASIAAVYPHMNHIGGDGFWLIREPRAACAPSWGGAGGREGDAAISIASTATTRSRRAGRSRRSPCRARSPAGCSRWRRPRRSAASCRSTCCSTPRSATRATAMW